MGMEVSVKRVSAAKSGWANATVSDPEEFMSQAFAIAALVREVNDMTLTAEEKSEVTAAILSASVALSHAVYGEFYKAKGDI